MLRLRDAYLGCTRESSGEVQRVWEGRFLVSKVPSTGCKLGLHGAQCTNKILKEIPSVSFRYSRCAYLLPCIFQTNVSEEHRSNVRGNAS
jgi:hypothetical protein